MKVGLLQFFSWTGRGPITTVYDRAMDRVDRMEDSAFDCIWLAEHHFTDYSVCPSVTLMGTHIAGRTKRLRIGTAVTLNAYYHPLRLVEELNMLDIFSRGRLNWGSGRGFDPDEFKLFGVTSGDVYDRFRETADIVQKAWQSERFSHHGKYYDYDNVMVLPRPYQDPHPPVYLAADSPDSIRKAGAEGYTIMLGPHSSNADCNYKRTLYQEVMEANGHVVGGRDLPIVRFVALGETRAQAESVARASSGWTVGAYANASKTAHLGPQTTTIKFDRKVDPVERYLNDVAIVGTAPEVVDRLKQLESEIPMNYLMLAPMSHDTFLRFTRDVLPKLA
ncbi:MAG: LLM class flavin-dependent oxidoreductase [Alphaproteobacteria bacterium]|nr:LLM class flavin-dependent oxidoreductase [Alphaproteobacteria bacterium]